MFITSGTAAACCGHGDDQSKKQNNETTTKERKGFTGTKERDIHNTCSATKRTQNRQPVQLPALLKRQGRGGGTHANVAYGGAATN